MVFVTRACVLRLNGKDDTCHGECDNDCTAGNEEDDDDDETV